MNPNQKTSLIGSEDLPLNLQYKQQYLSSILTIAERMRVAVCGSQENIQGLGHERVWKS